MKILLLEDEKMLRDSIVEYLGEFGYEIDPCPDGFEAKRLILKNRYDLLLLDINVPKIDGFTLLRTIKELNIKTPVIFISAQTDIQDLTHGFSLGCLDYIKKPFHLKEIVLRIENISIKNSPQTLVQIDNDYSFDFEKNTLFYKNKPELLTKKQNQIMKLLVQNIGIIVDFERLRESVWNGEPIDNATIRAEVNRLKKTLKNSILKNSRGVGYLIVKK